MIFKPQEAERIIGFDTSLKGFGMVLEGILKGFGRVLRLRQGTRILQNPFRDPFRNDLASRGL